MHSTSTEERVSLRTGSVQDQGMDQLGGNPEEEEEEGGEEEEEEDGRTDSVMRKYMEIVSQRREQQKVGFNDISNTDSSCSFMFLCFRLLVVYVQPFVSRQGHAQAMEKRYTYVSDTVLPVGSCQAF